MILLNSLVFDRDYSVIANDMPMESLKPIEEYGFSKDFYGGSITHIGKLKDSKVYLMIDTSVNGLQVKDVAITDFEAFPFQTLKDFAQAKKIPFKAVGTSKEALIDEIKKVTLVLN